MNSVQNMQINEDGVLLRYYGGEAVVTVPEGVTEIGYEAFEGNPYIKCVILPDSLKKIGAHAFSKSGIEEIEVPESVFGIGYEAFYECKNLRKVILPDQLEVLERSMFTDCHSLTEIELPSALKEIESGYSSPSFSETGIRHLVIPTGMKYINDSFRKMDQLESVYMPDSIISIGERAFSKCSALKEIRFSRNLLIIADSAFESCSSIEEVRLPEGLLTIGSEAFCGCRKLSKVRLPYSLKELNRRAFSGTLYAEKEEIGAIEKTINERENYQKPQGYSDLRFHKMKFFYKNKTSDKERNFPENIHHDTDLTDSIAIYKNELNENILQIRVSVPTFDSADREYYSYEKLFLFSKSGKLWGMLVAGGYRISTIDYYEDIRFADDLTAALLQAFGIGLPKKISQMNMFQAGNVIRNLFRKVLS